MSEHVANGSDVAVVYNASDFRALYRACRFCRRKWLLLILIIPTIFGGLSFADGYRGKDLAYEVIPYILLTLIVVFCSYFLLPLVQVRSRAKNGWGVPMTVRLTDQGIETRHPSQDSIFHWLAINDVVMSVDRVFVFTAPGCAIILPRRVFNNNRSFVEWGQFAKSHWQGAKAQTK